MAPKTLRFGHPGAALPGCGLPKWPLAAGMRPSGCPAPGPAHFRWHPGRRKAAVWVLPRRGRRSSDGTLVGTKLPPGCSCTGTGALQMALWSARSCRLGAPRRGRRSSDGTLAAGMRPSGCSRAGAGLFFGHPNGSKPCGWVLLPRPGRLKSGRP